MIILRSFFRKRTTRIYVLIFSLLLTVITAILLGKNYFLEYANNVYCGSHITLYASEDITDAILKQLNISDVKKGLVYNIDNDTIIIFDDKSLEGNEIITPKYIDDTLSDISLDISGKSYDFHIADKKGTNNYFFISDSLYLELANSYNSDYQYIIYLEDWFKVDKTIDNIRKNISYNFDKDIITFETKTINLDVKPIIIIFNIVTIIFISAFLITFVLSIENLLLDEKKISYLYCCLGYSKKLVEIITIIKVLFLIVLAIIIPLLISSLYFLLIV